MHSRFWGHQKTPREETFQMMPQKRCSLWNFQISDPERPGRRDWWSRYSVSKRAPLLRGDSMGERGIDRLRLLNTIGAIAVLHSWTVTRTKRSQGLSNAWRLKESASRARTWPGLGVSAKHQSFEWKYPNLLCLITRSIMRFTQNWGQIRTPHNILHPYDPFPLHISMNLTFVSMLGKKTGRSCKCWLSGNLYRDTLKGARWGNFV